MSSRRILVIVANLCSLCRWIIICHSQRQQWGHTVVHNNKRLECLVGSNNNNNSKMDQHLEVDLLSSLDQWTLLGPQMLAFWSKTRLAWQNMRILKIKIVNIDRRWKTPIAIRIRYLEIQHVDFSVFLMVTEANTSPSIALKCSLLR